MRLSSFLYPGLLALVFLACEKPAIHTYEGTWPDYADPSVATVSLYDTLPKKALANVMILELHGVKASYRNGRSTSYFEYEAEPAAIIRALSALPFAKTDVADTLPRKVDGVFSLSGKSILSEREIEAASFFWKIDPKEYTVFECLKGGQRHTLLVGNEGKILHRIQV